MTQQLLRTFRLFVSAVAAAMASFNFVRLMTIERQDSGKSAWKDNLLKLTRGLPHNPTTEMDLELWHVARSIQAEPGMRDDFTQNAARVLADRYRTGKLPTGVQKRLDQFLGKYGERGLGEIDLGHPRWNDDPTPVFGILAGYMQIERPETAPDAVFARGEHEAQIALEQLCQATRHTRGGWFKAHFVRFFARRLRELMGMRESPKFFAVRLFGLLRSSLLQIGNAMTQTGELQYADDLMYLTYNELVALATNESRDWAHVIGERREANRREQLRRQLPRVLMSDGRVIYEGILASDTENILSGSPVSPGRAEGNVRVVLNPHEAHLQPGEIMVCPGTDPSWTPLFLSASGLVMEVGGMMTHGAVVAREYGIPAIVGVDQATRRLATGQRIRMDGSSGVIEVVRLAQAGMVAPDSSSIR